MIYPQQATAGQPYTGRIWIDFDATAASLVSPPAWVTGQTFTPGTPAVLEITGTPPVAGQVVLTVQATNNCGPATWTEDITVVPGALPAIRIVAVDGTWETGYDFLFEFPFLATPSSPASTLLVPGELWDGASTWYMGRVDDPEYSADLSTTGPIKTNLVWGPAFPLASAHPAVFAAQDETWVSIGLGVRKYGAGGVVAQDWATLPHGAIGQLHGTHTGELWASSTGLPRQFRQISRADPTQLVGTLATFPVYSFSSYPAYIESAPAAGRLFSRMEEPGFTEQLMWASTTTPGVNGIINLSLPPNSGFVGPVLNPATGRLWLVGYNGTVLEIDPATLAETQVLVGAANPMAGTSAIMGSRMVRDDVHGMFWVAFRDGPTPGGGAWHIRGHDLATGLPVPGRDYTVPEVCPGYAPGYECVQVDAIVPRSDGTVFFSIAYAVPGSPVIFPRVVMALPQF